MRRKWADPEFRAKQHEGLKRIWEGPAGEERRKKVFTPESNKRRSEAAKNRIARAGGVTALTKWQNTLSPEEKIALASKGGAAGKESWANLARRQRFKEQILPKMVAGWKASPKWRDAVQRATHSPEHLAQLAAIRSDPIAQAKKSASEKATWALRSPPAERVCPTCGITFIVRKENARQKYCSLECRIVVPRIGRSYAHEDHFHRSKAELKWCERLTTMYDAGMLHANVHIKGLEVDFVIGKDRHDPSTWQKVIEYHPPRTWEGETAESYETKRRRRLTEVGVACPIEIILK